MSVAIRRVGRDAAAEVLGVVLRAFANRPALDPPADALAETEESIAALLEPLGGLVATVEGQPVGAVILDPVGDALFLRRFGVDPAAQGKGVARLLIQAGLEQARDLGISRVVVLAREELPATVQFWRDMGFSPVAERTPYVELARPVPLLVEVPTAAAMQELGARIGAHLHAGDLLVLTGGLGAGKTTFTQGLGRGLGVEGSVTSPTFVIARVHPGQGEGPDLVHVDAYRLGGQAELDDLDLDTDLDTAVTVIEWGSGLAEGLADSRLEVSIQRAPGADVEEAEDVDPRIVEIDPYGPRWLDAALAVTHITS